MRQREFPSGKTLSLSSALLSTRKACNQIHASDDDQLFLDHISNIHSLSMFVQACERTDYRSYIVKSLPSTKSIHKLSVLSTDVRFFISIHFVSMFFRTLHIQPIFIFSSRFNSLQIEKHRHQTAANGSGRFVLSPNAASYADSEHQSQHQFDVSSRFHRPIIGSADSHRPPDLLPYGQHQSVTIENSLANNLAGNFGTTSSVLSHNKHHTFDASSFDDDVNHGLIINNDYRAHGMNFFETSSAAQLLSDKHSMRRPSDEIDLRIYDLDEMASHRNLHGANEPSAVASMTTNTRTVIATGKAIVSPNRVRHSPSTASMASKSNASSFHNIHSLANAKKSSATTMAGQPMQQPSRLKFSDNGSTTVSNCKPRQSIVRTSSTSFSFLSTAYHHNQQQDHFLWCRVVDAVTTITSLQIVARCFLLFSRTK